MDAASHNNLKVLIAAIVLYGFKQKAAWNKMSVVMARNLEGKRDWLMENFSIAHFANFKLIYI